MNERRILQDHPTEAESRLLSSARMDAPSKSSKRGTFAALGLAAAATTTAGVGGAATPGAVAAGLLKWIALGAVGGVVTYGAMERLDPVNRAAGPQAQSTAVAARAEGRSKVAVATREPAPQSDPLGSAPSPSASASEMADLPAHGADFHPALVARPAGARAPSPSVDPAAVGPAVTEPATGAATAAPVPTLADEVSALDGARRMLAAGDAAAALDALSAYDRQFPHPMLRPEADLLRVEVLLALGQVDSARRLGERLLAGEPDSAYGQRVRSLLGRAPATAAPSAAQHDR